jgi:hypothetical protein
LPTQTATLTTGIITWTRSVNELVAEKAGFAKFVLQSLRRHTCLDCGDCTPDDKARNLDAVKDGGRVFSVYKDQLWPTIWIITEADRSATTVLFPEDY